MADAKKKSAAPPKTWRRVFPVAGVLLLLAVVVFFTWQETSNSHALDPEAVPDPVIGAVDAPIVITRYSDFGCPSCRSWHLAGIQERILAEYAGQVRFEWKDFAIIALQSPRASQAAHCAGAQDAFWDYHDLVYDKYAGIEEDALRDYAVALDLDMAQFDQCMDLAIMERKVRANEQEARRLGLRGTPGFAINGRPLPAPPSYEQLVTLIEAELE
ncbi:MAG: DsbA family protein [Caldilineaceae bacterium]|nr:DsbA family protein [Caldilineaceae bacterium]